MCFCLMGKSFDRTSHLRTFFSLVFVVVITSKKARVLNVFFILEKRRQSECDSTMCSCSFIYVKRVSKYFLFSKMYHELLCFFIFLLLWLEIYRFLDDIYASRLRVCFIWSCYVQLFWRVIWYANPWFRLCEKKMSPFSILMIKLLIKATIAVTIIIW